ncbi:5-bromo-4-chloroindolyl phosphate hydrolysis protein [Pacificibacter maritimus]|uniref:5-bromo-4-chloroindolyl phosphate hydrolysis protein n=1 Tax=Pacificibacter maritimus TaxID=762213 RepID=A0A3N4VE01_9RHOB|nr:5-bromo-4-chloroindolyl phosphate hydrolysis family protein [Pacificibacter maritimus]RPE72080.1 5-bromo-4-chloroindolyl phosphate hydrolysis protein [Pacificibacter maritimus]
MAQRYGSKYSPSSATKDTAPKARPFDGKKPSRVGARSNLLFYAALPLAWKAFGAQPVVMAQYLVALGLLLGAAWLTREGLKAHEAYDARKVARRPALPRKIFGSVLTGLGLGMVGLAGWGVIEAGIFAILGTALHSFSFGIDPLRHKGMEGVDTFQQDRVAKAVNEAEKHLQSMREALARTGDREAQSRLEQFTKTARTMFRTVEEDPRDLTSARKYLGVYLLGARDATVKFADIWANSRNTDARRSYLSLLDDLESNFTARNEALLLDNKIDLDIEIDVLRDRLAREGIK